MLDEADELLHDLFYMNMRWILDNSNSSKQVIVTTATVPPNVQFIMDRYLKYHEYIDLADQVGRAVEDCRVLLLLWFCSIPRTMLEYSNFSPNPPLP